MNHESEPLIIARTEHRAYLRNRGKLGKEASVKYIYLQTRRLSFQYYYRNITTGPPFYQFTIHEHVSYFPIHEHNLFSIHEHINHLTIHERLKPFHHSKLKIVV